MRPIDADALKKATEAHGEKIAYVVSFLWDIDAAPTIDAIPVEWLKAQNDSTEYFKTVQGQAVELILELWQKEQEAQDG